MGESHITNAEGEGARGRSPPPPEKTPPQRPLARIRGRAIVQDLQDEMPTKRTYSF